MRADSRRLHPRITEDSEFQLARVLYYLGMSFVAAGAIRPFGGLDISDWFFFASLAVAAGTVALRGATIDSSLPGLFVFGFAIFSMGAVFSLPVAFHPVDAAGAFARFTFTTLVWFALGSIVLRRRRHVEIAVAAWILSIAVSGLAAIAQVKWGTFLFAPFTTISFAGTLGFAGRQIGLSGHPNDLGGAAAIAVAPAILFAALRIWSEAQRYAFTALLCLVLACIVLSGSVTAFAAAGAAAALWSVTGRVAAKRLIVIAGTLTLMGAALVVINQHGASSVLSPLDRLAFTLGWTADPLATGQSRLTLDAIAWNEIVRNPLFGSGLDGVSVAQVLGGVGVHNMFLFVWVGAGVFGALGLLIMVSSLAATYIGEYRRSIAPADRTLALVLGTSFVSFLIVAMAEPIVFVRWGWVPAALLLPLRASRLRSEKAAQELTSRYGERDPYGTTAPHLPSQLLH